MDTPRRPKRKRPVTRAHRIASVTVEGLFGMYTYEIRVEGDSRRGGPSLLILYGDNGSGKTTILRLIYHLLSKEDDRGHRSYLARVPFRRLAVALDPGIIIEAIRSGSELLGTYDLRFSRGGKVVAQARAVPDAEGSVRRSAREDPEEQRNWEAFVQALADLDLSFFYLRDDRKAEEFRAEPEATDEFLDLTSRSGRLFWRRERDDADVRLVETVDRLERWIRDEALRGASIGEEGTRVVFADIAKRIAASRDARATRDLPSDDLEASLRALEKRSKPFAALGLISPPRLTDIVETLRSSPPDTRQLIAGVISPYIEGLKARIDAQQDLMELVTLFVERVNQFFHDKSASYTIERGLTIVTANGETLDARLLSSGERQLLALLAEVLIARGTATIFLIDEPEISLNVKWQRMMVDTLLQLVRGTRVQFVLATHSLELLASHRDHVFRLGPVGDVDDRAR